MQISMFLFPTLKTMSKRSVDHLRDSFLLLYSVFVFQLRYGTRCNTVYMPIYKKQISRNDSFSFDWNSVQIKKTIFREASSQCNFYQMASNLLGIKEKVADQFESNIDGKSSKSGHKQQIFPLSYFQNSIYHIPQKMKKIDLTKIPSKVIF